MTKLEQAARLALEALEAVSTAKERGFGIEYAKGYVDPVITALREALAEQAECPHGVDDGACKECYMEQAEQEPVACKHEWFRTGAMEIGESRCIHCGEWNYAAPVRTKDPCNPLQDLTDDEIYTLYSEPCSDREMIEFARAVIAADREKNK